MGRPDAATMASLLTRAVRAAKVAGVLPAPLHPIENGSDFLVGCHLESACTYMVRFLGLRSFKGQFEDLYPATTALTPMHKTMLEFSKSMVATQARLASDPWLEGNPGQREKFVVNAHFEARFGEFLRIAMQIQDKDAAGGKQAT